MARRSWSVTIDKLALTSAISQGLRLSVLPNCFFQSQLRCIKRNTRGLALSVPMPKATHGLGSNFLHPARRGRVVDLLHGLYLEKLPIPVVLKIGVKAALRRFAVIRTCLVRSELEINQLRCHPTRPHGHIHENRREGNRAAAGGFVLAVMLNINAPFHQWPTLPIYFGDDR